MASSTAGRIESASLIWTNPDSRAINAGDRPVPNISSNTSLAMLVLNVPESIKSSNSTRSFGWNLTVVISSPVRFRRRVNSPSIQLLTDLASPRCASPVTALESTTASKKSAPGLEEVRRPASYAGSPYCSMNRSFLASGNSGRLSLIVCIRSGSITTGGRSGSGKYR